MCSVIQVLPRNNEMMKIFKKIENSSKKFHFYYIWTYIWIWNHVNENSDPGSYTGIWIHPFLQNQLSAKELERQGIEYILSPKQPPRPLPSLVYLSFFYDSSYPNISESHVCDSPGEGAGPRDLVHQLGQSTCRRGASGQRGTSRGRSQLQPSLPLSDQVSSSGGTGVAR